MIAEHDAIAAFSDAMRKAGVEPPRSIVADGKRHRFSTNGARHDDAGWYLLHLDGIPAGAFGDWRSGVSQTWCSRRPDALTPDEREANRRRIDAAKREAAEEREREHREAAQRARLLWDTADPAIGDHPYLTRKRVKPPPTLWELSAAAIKSLAGYAPKAKGEELTGRVLIAPVVVSGGISSVEMIDEAGRKAFLAGGDVVGAYWASRKLPEGDGAGLTLLVAEGVATALSASEATGHIAIAALSAWNMPETARALRKRFPKCRLIMLADLDANGVGLAKAIEATRTVGGLVAAPDFGTARPNGAKDFNDVAAHHGLEAVAASIEAAKEADHHMSQEAIEKITRDGRASREAAWPTMDDAAYYGLAGDVVRAIAPHTEADSAAILVQFLAAFGNVIGNGPYYQVEGDHHRVNFFTVLVGETAKGRKGTSWSRVRQIFDRVERSWTERCVHSGLSSGEGVIWAVRDPIMERVREGKGAGAHYVETERDPGVADKRLLIIEPEFSGVLRVMQREGNTLSRVLRDAWDRGDLATLTKNSPARATRALLTIVGHITAHELRQSLDRADIANGFFNRFLPLCVRRARCLPHGGEVDNTVIDKLAERTREAIEHARQLGRVGMDNTAARQWEAVYSDLSEGRPGLLGAVIARAEAQVVRLALVYALLDGQHLIGVAHLRAALALWEYVEASAVYIFGDALGDPVADEIARALTAAGPAGMTRTAIRDLFGRHRSAGQIGASLAMLAQLGRIEARQTRETSGRPAEIWAARGRA